MTIGTELKYEYVTGLVNTEKEQLLQCPVLGMKRQSPIEKRRGAAAEGGERVPIPGESQAE